MARPQFLGLGPIGGTDAGGAWVATAHAPDEAGRIIILQVLQDGATSGAVTFTSATNIENLAGTANAWTALALNQAVGAGPSARQHLWVGRSVSTSTPTFTGGNSTSQDLYWRFYEYANVSRGTTLAEIIENVTAGSTANTTGDSSTMSATAITTLGPDRLALNFFAINDDNIPSDWSGATGGVWCRPTYYGNSAGTDGCVGHIRSRLWGDIWDTPVIQTNSDSPPFGTTTSEKIAQSITPTANLTSGLVRVNLGTSGSPTDDVVLEIQSESAGVPSGTVLATTTIPNAQLTGTITLFEVPLSASLTASTRYWVVYSRSGSIDDSNMFTSGGRFSGTPSIWLSGNFNGGVWSTSTTAAYMLEMRSTTADNTTTITGATGDIVDIDAWGIIGFALRPVDEVPYFTPYPQLLVR